MCGPSPESEHHLASVITKVSSAFFSRDSVLKKHLQGAGTIFTTENTEVCFQRLAQVQKARRRQKQDSRPSLRIRLPHASRHPRPHPPGAAARGTGLSTQQPYPSSHIASPCWAHQASGHGPRCPQTRSWAITSTPRKASPFHRLIKWPEPLFSKLQLILYGANPLSSHRGLGPAASHIPSGATLPNLTIAPALRGSQNSSCQWGNMP